MNKAEQELLDNELIDDAWQNDLDGVKECLARGAALDAEDYVGSNPLIVSVLVKNPEVADFLIASGINKEHKNHQGYAAIHFAVDDLPTLNSFLKSGANINIRAYDGITPLMRAVFRKSSEATQALLQAGADINLSGADGRTALMYAVDMVPECWGSYHNRELRRLVEAGADILAKDNEGLTAIDHAANHGLEDAVTYLKQCALEKELSGFKKGLAHPIKATRPIGFKP